MYCWYVVMKGIHTQHYQHRNYFYGLSQMCFCQCLKHELTTVMYELSKISINSPKLYLHLLMYCHQHLYIINLWDTQSSITKGKQCRKTPFLSSYLTHKPQSFFQYYYVNFHLNSLKPTDLFNFFLQQLYRSTPVSNLGLH